LKHRDDLIRAAAAAAAEEKGEDAEAAAAAADPSALLWAHVAHEIQVPLQLDVRPQDTHTVMHHMILFLLLLRHSQTIHSSNLCLNHFVFRCLNKQRPCFTCCARDCLR
jgi:hypothetical protein